MQRSIGIGSAAIAMSATLVIGACLGIAWAGNTNKDAVDIATAIGTCAAAFVALGIALSEGYRRHVEGIVRAKLIAASVSKQLDDANRGISTTIERIYEWCSGDRSGHFDVSFQFAQLANYQMVGTSDRLHALVPLPNNCAYNIAASIDLVVRVVRDLPIAFSTSPLPPGLTQDGLVQACLADLRAAAPMVKTAYEECQAAIGISKRSII
ncbi:hypothetical protein [Cupriavidus plantarum]|uniref:hypothetical protein n=1 Tax=Cupriavidus plantarum TaxID=942865 RepID=UPI00339D69A2